VSALPPNSRCEAVNMAVQHLKTGQDTHILIFRGISRASELAKENGSMAHLPKIPLEGQCSMAEIPRPALSMLISWPVHYMDPCHRTRLQSRFTSLLTRLFDSPASCNSRILAQPTKYICAVEANPFRIRYLSCLSAQYSLFRLTQAHSIFRETSASLHDARLCNKSTDKFVIPPQFQTATNSYSDGTTPKNVCVTCSGA
jgi:hypothetical protein